MQHWYTPDRRYMVIWYEDQTAELCEAGGKLLMERSPLHVVTDELVRLGYGQDGENPIKREAPPAP